METVVNSTGAEDMAYLIIGVALFIAWLYLRSAWKKNWDVARYVLPYMRCDEAADAIGQVPDRGRLLYAVAYTWVQVGDFKQLLFWRVLKYVLGIVILFLSSPEWWPGTSMVLLFGGHLCMVKVAMNHQQIIRRRIARLSVADQEEVMRLCHSVRVILQRQKAS